jgi:hypothetical protein
MVRTVLKQAGIVRPASSAVIHPGSILSNWEHIIWLKVFRAGECGGKSAGGAETV